MYSHFWHILIWTQYIWTLAPVLAIAITAIIHSGVSLLTKWLNEWEPTRSLKTLLGVCSLKPVQIFFVPLSACPFSFLYSRYVIELSRGRSLSWEIKFHEESWGISPLLIHIITAKANHVLQIVFVHQTFTEQASPSPNPIQHSAAQQWVSSRNIWKKWVHEDSGPDTSP